MREEDSSRYMSSLVKQDLAKLDADGDTRRGAMKSLKLLVEQLDSSTLPRFISQIADSRESDGTRSYSISLYEDVARVHGKFVIPHISKVMGSLVRSSSASGSFPQLQIASARVTVALAQYSVDSGTFQEDAENIMLEICAPLIDALAGKLEPVAANAAISIHALVENEQWKYANDEIVHEICQRTTVALSEKPTRTAAHMQLACILASTNPDTLSIYGASLLRAGEDILKVTTNPWQLRKAAAKLLQSVMTILDKETLETELHSALRALDSCRLDKMPHVRAAVTEALNTAKMLASGSATPKSLGMAVSPVRKSSERNHRSPWLSDETRGTSPRASMTGRADSVSPVPKRGTSPRAPMSPIRAETTSTRIGSPNLRAASPTSQQSRGFSYSPASTSASGSVQVFSARSIDRSKAKRAPVYPRYSPRSGGTPGTSPSSSTTTVEECESPSRRLIIANGSGRSRGMKVNRLCLGEDENQHLRNVDTDVLFGEDARHARLSLPRLKLGGINSQTGPSRDGGSRTEKENDLDISNACFEEEEREIAISGTLIRAHSSPVAGLVAKNGNSKVGDRFLNGESVLEAYRDEASAHLGLNSEEMIKSLTMRKDFLPFVPSARLVRSLSSLSNPEASRGSSFERDMELAHDEAIQSINAVPSELDAETSSEARWSVRDNPMASEESFSSDSSDEDMDHRSKGEDFPRLRKVGSVDSSPREIHMITTESKSRRPFDDLGGRSRKPEGDDDSIHVCPCADGLSNLLHKDEKVQDQVCSTGSYQRYESDAKVPLAGKSDTSSAKEVENQGPEGLSRFSPFRMVTSNWRALRWCAEAALGGSLFLAMAAVVSVAVPVVIVGKALNVQVEYERLVPT